MDNSWLLWTILIVIGVISLYILYRKNFKILKAPSVCLITGGVKTGKSLLSVNLSIKDYKWRHIKWWWATKVFKKDAEEPLYYTNVNITFGDNRKSKYCKLDDNIRYITLDHLLREYRFAYGSVIYIQECSLLADNMDFNNKDRNIELSLFNKLIGHETKGGVLYYDTQSPLDSHYSIKRVCSTYFFIEKSIDFFFFRVLYVRELINTENGVNVMNDDAETTMRKVLIPRWYYYKYNRYEFSFLTDTLSEKVVLTRFDGLVSFNPSYTAHADKRKKGGSV